MRTEIKYVNANGHEVILNSGNYTVSENDLRNFVWDYNTYNRPSGFGGRVSFSRGVQEKMLVVGVRAIKTDDFRRYAAELTALTEPDILNETPGKLYIGNQYITCYMSTSSEVQHYARRANWVRKELTVVVVEPFWHEEITQYFMIGQADDVQNGKKYNGRYMYRYISDISSREMMNDHYTASPMIITIYGPVEDPRLIIGGHEYTLTAEIVANQRIIIDQLRGTIVAKNPDGAETNLFDQRSKIHDIFRYIQPGAQHVIYTGAFAFDITIVQQRSEPKWN